MRIALLGSAPSSLRQAPFQDKSYVEFIAGRPILERHQKPFIDEEWEVWACSPGTFGVAQRLTAFFEMHRWEPGQTWFSPEYCDWLRAFKGPVYTTEVIPELPTSTRVPREAIVGEFGPYFLTSSLSFMSAMAILTIVEHRKTRTAPEEDMIAYFGVDMAACPSPETKVLTEDLRWVRADTLELGQKIIAFDEEAQPNGDSTPKRKWRVAEVLRNDRITKPCYRLTLEDGRELVCSDEHKWLTYAENTSRWKMAKDMVTSSHREDRPTRIIQLCDTWEEDKSWEAGYLAAAFDGEGHLTQKLREGDHAMLRIGFSQRDNPMSRMVIACCEKMGFELAIDSMQDGGNGDCVKYTIRGGRAKTMEFIGRIRPRRLIEKFTAEYLGIMQKTATVAVVKAEFIGEQEVIGLTTSTGTFVAEGLATHNTEEYSYQRQGCQFYVGEAARRGIKIALPPESDLLRPMPMYGVSEWTHAHIKIMQRSRELNARLVDARAQKQGAHDQEVFLSGAIDNLNYMRDTWVLNDNSPLCGPDIHGKQMLYLNHDGKPAESEMSAMVALD